MKIVTLSTTLKRVRRDLPSFEYSSQRVSQPGVVSYDYDIVPEKCTTELGRWLAEHISTTCRKDDASICLVLLPATELGMHFKKRIEQLTRCVELRTKVDAEGVLIRLENWVAEQRQQIRLSSALCFRYRIVEYDWPVYGSAAAEGAESPEAYFDVVGRQIQKTGGVILCAGLSQDRLPCSIAETMAQDAGGGLALLRRREALSLASSA